MNCTFCGSEMDYNGPYGRFAAHQDGKKIGDIYKCPNAEGFQSEDEALEYLQSSGQTLEENGWASWEEIVCWSSVHHVSGSFYTDEGGDLHEGYPC
jgi:hypothetical protein